MEEQPATIVENLINTNMGVLLSAQAQKLLTTMPKTPNNQASVKNVIEVYNQVAQYFKKAHDDASYQHFSMVSDSLQKALTTRDQAKKSEEAGDIDQALALYQKTYIFFAQAGDGVNAEQINNALQQLQANQSIHQAHQLFTTFLTTYKAPMQNYFATMSTYNIEPSVSSFENLIAALLDTIKKSITAYAVAKQSYQELGNNTNDLTIVLSFLDNAMQGFTFLEQGDQIARGGTNEGLNTAQTYYAQAELVFKKADTLYKQNKIIESFVSGYPAQLENAELKKLITGNQEWNYVTMLQRHSAKVYIETAATLNNSSLALQYYIAADSARSGYLSTQVDQFLTGTIKSIGQVTKPGDMLTQEAESKEKQVLKLDHDAWLPDTKIQEYSSVANTAWHDLLRTYAVGLRLSVTGFDVGYNRVISEYAQAYEQNVPEKYYPSLGSALIYYRSYLFNEQKKDSEHQAMIVKKIDELLHSYFSIAQDALKQSANVDLVTSGTDNQAHIVAWMNKFDQALTEQQGILNEYGITDPSLEFLKKNIDTKNNTITYDAALPGQQVKYSITIPNPDATYAALYLALANTYFNQKKYDKAYEAYALAKKYFDATNNSKESKRAQDRYDLSYTRALVDAYRNLIIPGQKETHGIAMIPVGTLSVPERYELYNYVQEIPSYIPITLNLQTLAHDQSQQAAKAIQDALITYAFLLYVDNELKDHGIAYQDVFDGYELREHPNVSSDQLPLILTFVNNASRFRQNLKDRIASNQSSLHLEARNDSYGKPTFFLAESYKPIPVLPLPTVATTHMAYSRFPNVILYYRSAQNLSDPHKDVIQLGGKSFVSGNDQAVVTDMMSKSAQAFLSAADVYKKRIDFLFNGGDVFAIDPLMSVDELSTLTLKRASIEALKKISKSDMSVQLSGYTPLYDFLKMYANDIVATYYGESSSLYEQLQDTQKNTQVQNALSDLYTLLGDASQLFLVGDPRAVDYFWGSNGVYGGILYEIKDDYIKAIGYAGKASKNINVLLDKAAQLFTNAGTILVNQKNYFAAILYYAMALGAYKATQPRDEQKIAQAAVNWLGAYYKGSTELIAQYQEAQKSQLTITLSTGEQEKISFDQLLINGQFGDSAEQEAYQKYKNMLLDSIIYYSGCSSAANGLIDKSKNTPDISKQALDLISSYTQKKQLSLDSLKDVNQWMARPDFKQTVLDMFDLCSEKILSADSKAQTVGYTVLSEWTNKLFFAFGLVYMHNYLGGKQPQDQYTGFMQAIKDEEQAIIAPADQWIH